MQPKTIQLLALIFAILLFVTIYPWIMKSIPTNEKLQDSSLFPLATFSMENSQKITITKGSQSVTLAKKGNDWNIQGYSVSKSAIASVFSATTQTKVGHIVSKNKENHTAYGVASESATIISLTNSVGEKQFLFGLQAPADGSVYARMADSNWVYQIQTDLPSVVFTTVDEWREKSLTSFDSSLVYGVELSGGLPPIMLAKKDDTTWELSLSGTKKTVKQTTVAPVIASLSQLNATGFIEKSENDLSKTAPEETLTFKGKDGSVLAVLTLIKNDDSYVVQKNDNPDWFVLPQASLAPLMNLISVEE